jgi:uncharacterized protein
MRRWIVIALSLVGAAVVVAAVLVAVRARSEAHNLLHNPMETRTLPGRTPGDFAMAFEDVGVTTSDGLSLVGWYIPSKNRAAVIAQHGYKAHRGEMLEEAAMLAHRGFGVLITTFRAHDLSEGSLITFGREEMKDLEAWDRFLRRRADVDPARIGFLGNSLGGTLGIQYAAEHAEIAAVATSSAFSSLSDTIDRSVRFFTGLPPFPFATLITFWAEREAQFDAGEVDAKRWIGRLSPRPVFLMQGGADVVISKQSGEWLLAAANQPKELWFDAKVGHANFDRARPEEFARRVGGFFEKYLTAAGAPAGGH